MLRKRESTGEVFGLVLWIAVVWCLTMAQVQAAVRFGEIVKASGEINSVEPKSGATRKLAVGDSVFVGERLEAGDAGEAIIKTDDAGVIAMRPRSVFYLQNFKPEPLAESRFDIRIVRGALRLITGLIGTRNKPGYRIQTTTATIGIRGTDQEPFVVQADRAASLGAREGTYNKVYSGEVQLQTAAGNLTLAKGQAGFAPAPQKSTTRGLMTALLPVLLERAPDFYLPGKFDEGLEQYAAQLLSKAMEGAPEPALPVSAVAAPSAVTAVQPTATQPRAEGACPATQIAQRWLDTLDRAIEQRDPQAFVDLFAPDVQMVARTRTEGGEVIESTLARGEFIQSTFSSLNQLSQFRFTRFDTTARALDTAACRTIAVESTVIENGVMGGRSYQLESREVYELQLGGKVWRARKALTTQK